MYDEKLNNNTLYFLYYAFFLQMFFGYWMFSNKQIFSNKILPVERADAPMKSGHSIWDPIEFNQAFPFLFCGILFIIWNLGHCVYLGFVKHQRQREWSYEDLRTYLLSLKPYDKEWLKTEEEYIREVQNYRLLPDNFYRKLLVSHILFNRNALNNKRFIQNVPTYDILANPYYEERFQYFPAMSRGDLDSKIFMSAKVRSIINLPYLTSAQFEEFEFENNLFKAIEKKVSISIS